MSKATDISKINEHSPYYDMTPGNQIYGGGGSRSVFFRKQCGADEGCKGG